jgi:hypothetical protein
MGLTPCEEVLYDCCTLTPQFLEPFYTSSCTPYPLILPPTIENNFDFSYTHQKSEKRKEHVALRSSYISSNKRLK